MFTLLLHYAEIEFELADLERAEVRIADIEHADK